MSPPVVRDRTLNKLNITKFAMGPLGDTPRRKMAGNRNGAEQTDNRAIQTRCGCIQRDVMNEDTVIVSYIQEGTNSRGHNNAAHGEDYFCTVTLWFLRRLVGQRQLLSSFPLQP